MFDPQSRPRQFTKDDDHCAMIIELLGDEYKFDEAFRMGGRKSRILFDSQGAPPTTRGKYSFEKSSS